MGTLGGADTGDARDSSLEDPSTSIRSTANGDKPLSSIAGSVGDGEEKKQEGDLCKICYDQVAEVVFVPCGHFGFCRICSERLTRCPVCRKFVQLRQRTFRV